MAESSACPASMQQPAGIILGTPSEGASVEVDASMDEDKVHIRGADGKLVTVFKLCEGDERHSQVFKTLQQLDLDGKGEIDLQDLLTAMTRQEALNQTVAKQRNLIAAMLLGIVLLFLATLGSSIWASLLTREMSVYDGALVSADGEPVRTRSDEVRLGADGVLEVRAPNGSQASRARKPVQVVPHSPTVRGLQLDANSSDNGDSRRLQSAPQLRCTLPLEEAMSIAQQFASGVASFVTTLPCMDMVVSVLVAECVSVHGAPTLRGTAAGGMYEWVAACDPSQATCSVVGVALDSKRAALRRRLASSVLGDRSTTVERSLARKC